MVEFWIIYIYILVILPGFFGGISFVFVSTVGIFGFGVFVCFLFVCGFICWSGFVWFYCDLVSSCCPKAWRTQSGRENISVLPLLIYYTVQVAMEHLMKLPHNRAALDLPEDTSFSVISILFLLVIFHKFSLLTWHKKPGSIHLDTRAWGHHVWTCWTSCCSRRLMETKDHCRQIEHISLFIDCFRSVLKVVALPALALLCLDNCSSICPNPSLVCFYFFSLYICLRSSLSAAVTVRCCLSTLIRLL